MTDLAERPDVPRHDLIRGITPVRSENDGNTMIGYPIVFDQWTEINSWEGRFLERVAPSGPVQSMKSNGSKIKVQYNHGMHPVVGTSGLGKPAVMRTDDFGVYTEVPLTQTSYNRDIIKPQLVDGTLDGMSFRFSVVKDDWVDPTRATSYNPEKLPERTLIEFKWFEFGPVDHPAYEAAQAGIRSQAAFAMWLQTPEERRAQVMRQFEISAPSTPRIWAPGWEPTTAALDVERDANPPADEPVTGGETPDTPSGPVPTPPAEPETPPADDPVTEPEADEPPARHSSPPRRRLTPGRLDADLEYVHGITTAVDRHVADNERLVVRYEAQREKDEVA